MEKSFTLSIASDDLQALKALRQSIEGEPISDVTISNTQLKVTPGVIATTAILTMALTYLSGVSSKVLASWIYDKFIRPKSPTPKFDIYINGVKIDQATVESPAVIQQQLDKASENKASENKAAEDNKPA